jgi:hypothetical protein
VGEVRRYTFNALERRGLMAGFQGSQLAVLAAGCVVSIGALRASPTPAGVIAAGLAVSVAAAAACWTVAGRPPGAWVHVGFAWLWRRHTRSHRSPPPSTGLHARPGGAVGGGRRGCGRHAGEADESRPPRSLAGLRLLVAPAVAGAGPMGVVNDRRTGTYAVLLAVRGRSFPLLDPIDKQHRVAAWGAALAAMAREGSPIHRLQWVQRTLPGDSDGLVRYLDEAAVAEGPARESYARLVAGAGPAMRDHQVLLAIAVHARQVAKHRRAFGPGLEAAYGLLRREIRLVQGQLRVAELIVERVLDEADVADALRVAVDPAHRPGRPGRRCRQGDSWPLATDEGWSSFRSDSGWHATYWVSQWPRVEVGPDFLAPLLVHTAGRRTASVTMAPVGPARAAREAESARTADAADDELRRRAGFLATARRRREVEGVLRRESELADGHAEYRFSGYVTVSAFDRAGLDAACSEVEQAASQAHLELRRLYGQQEEAFTWTLPLARGLR